MFNSTLFWTKSDDVYTFHLCSAVTHIPLSPIFRSDRQFAHLHNNLIYPTHCLAGFALGAERARGHHFHRPPRVA